MNQEMHERTVIALARAACTPFYVKEDLDLLCWHCGVKLEELQGVKVNGYRIADQYKYANDELEKYVAEIKEAA